MFKKFFNWIKDFVTFRDDTDRMQFWRESSWMPNFTDRNKFKRIFATIIFGAGIIGAHFLNALTIGSKLVCEILDTGLIMDLLWMIH